MSPKEVDDVLKEVKVLSRMRHRNIVQYLESFMRKRLFVFVYSFIWIDCMT